MTAPVGYRALLRLLPRRLRETHGEAMATAFSEALADARSADGAGAVAGVWASGAWDVVKRAAYERTRWLRGGLGGPWSPIPDLKFAFRSFLRQPGITFLVVLMLSLGIAASTSVFTLVDGIFLRPLPFEGSSRLVYLNERAPAWNLERTGINFRDFDTWRENAQAFEAMGLFTGVSHAVAGEDGAQRVDGLQVTWDYGPTLGVEPVLGRAFTPEDDRPGAPPVVLLGYGLWRSRFGGSPDVVGESLRVDGEPRTVIGVLPPEASFPGDVQLWSPLRLDPVANGNNWMYQGVGRLNPGVTLEAARSDLTRAHSSLWETIDTDTIVSPVMVPLRAELTSGLRGVGLALGLAAAMVLLIACGNVASLLLARSFARRRELSIRSALGAGRRRIAGQLLAESLALALVAGPLGVVLGFWGVSALTALSPADLPSWMAMEPSWRMAAFGVALIFLTTVLFGWAPVLQARRQDVREALAGGGPRSSGSRAERRTMSALVVAEITLAATLLVAGGLLLRTSRRLQQADPGFRTENVLGFRVALPQATYPDAASRVTFFWRLTDELEARPEVRVAGGITCPPLGCHTGGFFVAEGGLGMNPADPDPVVLYRNATPGYFEAMGIPAVAGRLLEPQDFTPETYRVAVINQTFARRFFPDTEDPVGLRIAFRGQNLDSLGYRVVGVARDVSHYGVDTPMRPGIYFPYDPNTGTSLAMFVWADVDAASLAPTVRDIVRSLDPELPLFQVGTTAQSLRDSLAGRRANAWSMTVFAGLALFLALGGIYGVLSYAVGQRRREIGIRVALGATDRRVVRLVLRHGLLLAGAGLGLALPVAVITTHVLGGLLVDVSPLDPLTFLAAGAVLTTAALVATLMPARRALRVEPGSALRDE